MKSFEYFREHFDVSHHAHESRAADDSKKVEFWHQVERETLEEFLDVFKFDFEMFGYSMDDSLRRFGLEL